MSVEDDKRKLRQEAARLRLKRLREGKNPVTGKRDKPKEEKKAVPKSALDKIKDFFGHSVTKKAAER